MSLNKFTSSVERKEWMNINANDIKCATLEVDVAPWTTGSTSFKLQPAVTYTAFDVTGISHLWVADAGLATINSLSGGVDGQKLTVMCGGFGGTILFKHEFSTGAPGEQLLFVQTAADFTSPLGPALVGTAQLTFDLTNQRWLTYAE